MSAAAKVLAPCSASRTMWFDKQDQHVLFGDIRHGFAECFRVLEPEGILIFKWNETQVLVSELLALTDEKPLFGHKSGKREKTHWITFMKRR
ncbi:MAG TPA: hypothetical protein VG536_03715 [Pseudomonas sp.]|nr:hypothetical protein [Pseudomonas sp.]